MCFTHVVGRTSSGERLAERYFERTIKSVNLIHQSVEEYPNLFPPGSRELPLVLAGLYGSSGFAGLPIGCFINELYNDEGDLRFRAIRQLPKCIAERHQQNGDITIVAFGNPLHFLGDRDELLDFFYRIGRGLGSSTTIHIFHRNWIRC